MKAIVKYVHRISPRDTDREGPFPITESDLTDAESARKWLKRNTGDWPRLKHARCEEGRWIFFPPDKCGNWWSISIIVEK
jgi:hypothetical protein